MRDTLAAYSQHFMGIHTMIHLIHGVAVLVLVQFGEVLQLVVQHCPEANTPATLCALLGVNSN